MSQVEFDVDEITVKDGDTLDVTFGKKGRYTLSFDSSDGDTEINLYDIRPDGIVILYTGTFKEFRKVLTKAGNESEEEESGTATAFR